MRIMAPNGQPVPVPESLTDDGERYVWARLYLGFRIAKCDRQIVESLGERGMLPAAPSPRTRERP